MNDTPRRFSSVHQMRNVSKQAACFISILLVLASVLVVEGRFLQNSASSSSSSQSLTSDGVDQEDDGVETQKSSSSHLFLRGNSNRKTEHSEQECEQMYGFLPCSTNMFGHLFLIMVYEFFLFHGESYLASGGERIFKILGPGLLGASAFDLLGALPESLILLVTGLSRDSKESAQEYAYTGVGILAGSSILLLTIVWGTCVLTGSQNFDSDPTTTSITPKQLLTGFGISMDKETKEMAGIMVLSVIPLLLMQIPSVFGFSSFLRSVTLMVALAITLIFVLFYLIYQIFKPQIEKTRLDYIKHDDLILKIFEHVEKKTLAKILTEDGSPNVAAIDGLYKEISQHNNNNNDDDDGERDLFTSEVKELLLKNKLSGTNISEQQVEDMLKVFDRNGDQIITKDEFVNGLTQWIQQTKHALDKQYIPRKSLRNIYQGFLKPWMEYLRKEREMKGHLISEILRHSQRNMVGRLLNDDGTVNEAALRRLFEEVDKNRDNRVSQSELRELVTKIHISQGEDEEEVVNKILQDFDINSDNVISEKEFVDGFTKWLLSSSSTQASHAKPLPHHEQETHQTWEYVEKVVEEKHHEKGIYGWMKAITNVVLGITILCVLAEPLIASVQNFSEEAGIPSFFASFILVPLAINFREATSAIREASHHKRNNTSHTIYEIYGAVFMNNILGFTAVASLIYARGIRWEFSAEALVVAIVCSVMGLSASFRLNFPMWTSLGAYLLYLMSLVLVYVLHYD